MATIIDSSLVYEKLKKICLDKIKTLRSHAFDSEPYPCEDYPRTLSSECLLEEDSENQISKKKDSVEDFDNHRNKNAEEKSEPISANLNRAKAISNPGLINLGTRIADAASTIKEIETSNISVKSEDASSNQMYPNVQIPDALTYPDIPYSNIQEIKTNKDSASSNIE